MSSNWPDTSAHAGGSPPAAEPLAADPIEHSRRLQAVLVRCRTGLQAYGARRERWWRERLKTAGTAARQARSLAFGRKGTEADDRR